MAAVERKLFIFALLPDKQVSDQPPTPHSPTGHPKRQLEGNHTAGYRVVDFENLLVTK